MKYFVLFSFLIFAVVWVSTYGAPQSGGGHQGHLGGTSGYGLSLSGSASGSASASGSGSGPSSSGSQSDYSSSSLVKRDLMNHDPIAHHVHTASCFGGRGGGGGGGGPPPPAPTNSTSG